MVILFEALACAGGALRLVPLAAVDAFAAADSSTTFFASRSLFTHIFFSSFSILVMCVGTLRPPLLTASKRRLCAVPLTLDGGRP